MNSKFLGIIALQIWDLLDSDSEDGDAKIETTKFQLEKVTNFSENIVPNMTEKQFKEHFRMSASTFENFLEKIYNCNTPVVKKGQPEISLEKRCLITIWCLANPECFRSVADRFGIAISTCWKVLYLTCNDILKVNKNFNVISWPTNSRIAEIATYFRQKNGMDGVMGCIDGSHIAIKAPKNSPNSYVNRKGFHSVLLQSICDHQLLFLDCYAGEAGSIHDALLYQRSDISKAIQRGVIKFPNDTYIVGDAAYPLKEYLVTPFKNTGYLTERQQNFNHVLSKVRQSIERAFAFLKGRWRRLKFLETVRPDLAVLIIISACVMHNICILESDTIEIQTDPWDDSEIHSRNTHEIPMDTERPTRNAINKRNDIVNRLS